MFFAHTQAYKSIKNKTIEKLYLGGNSTSEPQEK